MTLTTKTHATLRPFALIGARETVTRIFTLFPEIRREFTRAPTDSTPTRAYRKPRKPKRRRMSAEARRKIGAAVRARWAARRRAEHDRRQQ